MVLDIGHFISFAFGKSNVVLSTFNIQHIAYTVKLLTTKKRAVETTAT